MKILHPHLILRNVTLLCNKHFCTLDREGCHQAMTTQPPCGSPAYPALKFKMNCLWLVPGLDPTCSLTVLLVPEKPSLDTSPLL